MYKHLSDGSMFDTSRGLMIKFNPDKPYPVNREQQDISYVKIDTMRGLRGSELDYLYRYAKHHKPVHGPNQDQNVPLWTKMNRVFTYRRHMNELRVWLSTQYSCVDDNTSIWDKSFSSRFERWTYNNCYNQWYILNKAQQIKTMDLLKPTRKYKRMKNKKALKIEINKLNAEIAMLQRRKRRLKQAATGGQNSGPKNNKAPVSY